MNSIFAGIQTLTRLPCLRPASPIGFESSARERCCLPSILTMSSEEVPVRAGSGCDKIEAELRARVTVGEAPADGGGGHDVDVLLCETQLILSALAVPIKCLYGDARDSLLFLVLCYQCFKFYKTSMIINRIQKCAIPIHTTTD